MVYKSKEMVKDIGKFSLGSILLGGGAAFVGSAFPGHGAGLTTVSRFMPVMGTLVMTKHMVGMTGNVIKELPKSKKHRYRY